MSISKKVGLVSFCFRKAPSGFKVRFLTYFRQYFDALRREDWC